MKPNTHPVTGIAFGVIAADKLDPDIVDALMYGPQAKDTSYAAAKKEWIEAEHFEFEREQKEGQRVGEEFDEDSVIEDFNEQYENYEPRISGEYQGVKYKSSWVGGALHFFIIESPHIEGHAQCSPCAPGAGDLHNDGDLLTYDVPEEWRMRP